MIRILYFIIFALMFFFACNRPIGNVHNISNVTLSDTLYGNETMVPIDILMPNKMIVLDTSLIIFDQNGDNLFHVFDVPTLKYKYSFGKVGGGPDEFTNIDPNSIKALNGDLVFLDNNKVIRMRVESNKAERISSYVITVGPNPLNRLQMLNDSLYIADIMDGENEYSLMNIRSGSELKRFGIYPSLEFGIGNDMNRYQAFIKASVLNPINNKFAVFYLYHNKMKIYDDGDLLSETNIEHSYGKYVPDETADNLIFRSEPVATAHHIYTLNIEERKKDINFTNFRPKIEIWDWEGDLIAKYPLDKSIITFSVSEKFGKIFASSIENADKIYVFDLPTPLMEEKKTANMLEYKKVDNHFYTVDLPKLLSYTTSSPEQEKNKITKYNGFLYNSCYFAALPSDSKDLFKGSLAIVIASEINKSIDNLTLDEFIERRDENLTNKSSSYTSTSSTINLERVVITDSEYEGIDPKGVPFNLKSRKWRWRELGKFVEINYSSNEDFELHVGNIERVVTSFRLKPNELTKIW